MLTSRPNCCEVLEKAEKPENTTNSKKSVKRKQTTQSLSEIVSLEMNRQKSNRVNLNPFKHEHNTHRSIRKRHNSRPSKQTSMSISYVPDISSSETDTEPKRKHQKTCVLSDNSSLDSLSSSTKLSRLSEDRMRAQEHITRRRLQTKEGSHTRLIGTCVVSPPPKIKDEKEMKIKLEIKIEQNKPLTPKQRERLRRRNRQEAAETGWVHHHYRPGKGFLKHCCEHAEHPNKSVNDANSATDTTKGNETTNIEPLPVNTNNVRHLKCRSSKKGYNNRGYSYQRIQYHRSR